MKRKIISVTLILLLVLSSTAMAFAEGQTRDTNLVNYSIDRTSRTTAVATVNVMFSDYVDEYSVIIYLQKKVDGQWTSDVMNPDYAFYNSGTGQIRFAFNHIYSNLEAGEIYRLKCVSRDYIDNQLYVFTTYSNQF